MNDVPAGVRWRILPRTKWSACTPRVPGTRLHGEPVSFTVLPTGLGR